MDSEIWPWFSFALAIVAIALILLFLLERERRKPLGEETAGPVKSEIRFGPPFPTKRTITTDMFKEARDKLALRYREDLARIKEEMARGESIVALDELERMQEEFVRLFSERFEELTKRIEEVRALSGYVPAKTEAPTVEERLEPEGLAEIEKKEEHAEVPKHPGEEEAPPKVEKKVSKPKAPSEPEKSEAERKIEQIVAEVEKVLKRLGQMEVEE